MEDGYKINIVSVVNVAGTLIGFQSATIIILT